MNGTVPPVLSIQTMAARLDVSPDYIRKAINRGEMEAERIGTRVRVTEAEFHRWYQSIKDQTNACR